jgi:hypothetical protein
MTQSKEIKWETQSCKQRSGRESLDGPTPWSTQTQRNKGAWSALEKDRAKRSSRRPRLVGSGQSASPPFKSPGAPFDR